MIEKFRLSQIPNSFSTDSNQEVRLSHPDGCPPFPDTKTGASVPAMELLLLKSGREEHGKLDFNAY